MQCLKTVRAKSSRVISRLIVRLTVMTVHAVDGFTRMAKLPSVPAREVLYIACSVVALLGDSDEAGPATTEILRRLNHGEV